MPKRPHSDSGTRLAEELRAIPLPSEPLERALAAAPLDDDGEEPSRPAWAARPRPQRRFARPRGVGAPSHRGA